MYKRIIATAFLSALICQNLQALPIGFGHNQGSLEYDEKESKDFIIYHDRRTPHEAQMTLNSLRAAKPHLERWMKIERDKQLPVIMTAYGRGPSFANFITDVIELQTGGYGTRDLAWHELTHTTMYEHLHNILGPAGAIIHLAWMPSWFLEGLAESTSVSINSAIQSGFERYHALTGRWPTYESLHSLYSGFTDSYLGYAASGAFVSYLIRHKGLDRSLPALLEDFYGNSMPWMWPWALFPYGPFLPLDDSLEELTKKEGRELWEEYKQKAFTHWKAQTPGEFIYNRKGTRLDMSHIRKLQFRSGKLFGSYSSGGDYYVSQLNFDADTGWYKGNQKVKKYDAKAEYFNYTKAKNRYTFSAPVYDAERRQGFKVFWDKNTRSKLVKSWSGQLIEMFETKKTYSFLIRDGERVKLCSVRKKYLNSKNTKNLNSGLICATEVRQPRLVEFGGQDHYEKSNFTQTIWLTVTDQKLKGDSYSVIKWQPDILNREIEYFKTQEKLTSLSQHNSVVLAVTEGTSSYAIRRYKTDFTCLSQYRVADIPTHIIADKKGGFFLRLLHGARDHLIHIDQKKLPRSESCSPLGSHSSPLLYAQHKPTAKMQEAFSQTDIWKKPVQTIADATPDRKLVAQQDAKVSESVESKPAQSRPAKFRVRPVFMVPWVGGDSGGSNFGILSMPLMDHMQNFTLQLSALYGAESRFPTTQLSAFYTGFWPRLKFDAFRYQTWNGVYIPDEDSGLTSAYLDEKGVRFTATFKHRRLGVEVETGMKSSHLKPYRGPSGRVGRLNEPFLNISKSTSFGLWSWSNALLTAAAPEGLNEKFDYNKYTLSSTLLRRVLAFSRTHRFSFGLSYGRTRGKKVRRLRESYRPLRIYIPDGGGGLNNISIPIVSGGGLFSATFGDTSARTKIDYSVPLIENVDALVRLFYIHELKFSAFVNYGGAWYQTPFPEDTNRLIGAHGYALDLLFDLKGINFNLGGGTGQVFGEPFEVYFTFGFDQIF